MKLYLSDREISFDDVFVMKISTFIPTSLDCLWNEEVVSSTLSVLVFLILFGKQRKNNNT